MRLRNAAMLTESFSIPQTGDRGYRYDTVIESCIWYRGILLPSPPIIRRLAVLLQYHFP